jgi:hypothetical protein
LISSAASLTPSCANSPSGPRKPVSGVRWPMRMESDCALTIAGMPMPARMALPPTPFIRARRVTSFATMTGSSLSSGLSMRLP